MAFSTREMACIVEPSIGAPGVIALKRLAAATMFSKGIPK
jgi:hypothetical protein